MWDLVNSQLNRAGEALLSMDKELAHEVTYREKRVNAFELKIDSDCEDIIGLYNPVALDLRFTLAMMKTSNNLERIADFCDGIARFVIDYPEVNIESELFEKTGIKEMLDIVKAMMLQAENALIEEKSSEAIAVFNKDNRVDELNHAAVPIIAEYLQQFPERAIECLNLISIIRRLELHWRPLQQYSRRNRILLGRKNIEARRKTFLITLQEGERSDKIKCFYHLLQ